MDRFMVHPEDLPLMASVLMKTPRQQRRATVLTALARTELGWALYKKNGLRQVSGYPHLLQAVLNTMPHGDRGLEAHQEIEFLECLSIAASGCAVYFGLDKSEREDAANARMAAE